MNIQTFAGAALLLALAACQPAAETPIGEAAAPGATTAAAPAAQVNCRIEVADKVWLDGPCDYKGAGGQLILNVRPEDGEDFVYIDEADAAVSHATWSGGGGGSTAQSPLGALTRDGACWTGEGTRICFPSTAQGVRGSDPQAPVATTHCLIKIDGVVQLDASCPISMSDPAATRINSISGWAPAQAEIRGGADAPTAYWNGGSYNDTMRENLGPVVRDGLCWTNDRVRICRPATPAWDGAAE